MKTELEVLREVRGREHPGQGKSLEQKIRRHGSFLRISEETCVGVGERQAGPGGKDAMLSLGRQEASTESLHVGN